MSNAVAPAAPTAVVSNSTLPAGNSISVRKEMRQSRIGSSASMDSTISGSNGGSSVGGMLYRKSYPNNDINASFSSASVAGSIQVCGNFFVYFFLNMDVNKK